MNPFLQLQLDANTRLGSYVTDLGVSYFADIPVIREDTADIEQQLQTALGRSGFGLLPGFDKAGLAICLQTPRGKAEAGKLIGMDLTLRVSILEFGLVNRAPASENGPGGINKPAMDVLWNVICALRNWAPNPGCKPTELISFDPLTVVNKEDLNDITEGFVVDFRCHRNIPIPQTY